MFPVGWGTQNSQHQNNHECLPSLSSSVSDARQLKARCTKCHLMGSDYISQRARLPGDWFFTALCVSLLFRVTPCLSPVYNGPFKFTLNLQTSNHHAVQTSSKQVNWVSCVFSFLYWSVTYERKAVFERGKNHTMLVKGWLKCFEIVTVGSIESIEKYHKPLIWE